MTTLNRSENGISSRDLDRAYLTALLLTGSGENAEKAVSAGIAAMDENQLSGESLLRESIRIAVAHNAVEIKKIELPLELWRVCCLPWCLRDAFVLRILVNLPRAVCACMLQCDQNQLDERVRAAARLLALGAPVSGARER
ncbi:MAG TPA: hypothetical protein VMB85_11905 [Bryobacteraceae bacterium]|nr:hypothetical protein [Bryobacteraceae bacterium]